MEGNMRTGRVVGVNGNMVAVAFDDRVMQNEVAYVLTGGDRLKSEVIRVRGNRADLQVFEDTGGVRVGDTAEFTGELLGVELGPGLLGKVFDGLQNPLPDLARQHGYFLKRGAYLPALDYERQWEFTPAVAAGARLRAGQKLGGVPEGIFDHWIMVPFRFGRELVEVVEIAPRGTYTVRDTVARLADADGRVHDVSMRQTWPVKIPITAYVRKLKPEQPLVTKIRIIDTLVPVAIGGTFCSPGPFGAGKTVLQHLLSRHANVDIVVVAACGGAQTGAQAPAVPEAPRDGEATPERVTLRDETPASGPGKWSSCCASFRTCTTPTPAAP